MAPLRLLIKKVYGAVTCPVQHDLSLRSPGLDHRWLVEHERGGGGGLIAALYVLFTNNRLNCTMRHRQWLTTIMEFVLCVRFSMLVLGLALQYPAGSGETI